VTDAGPGEAALSTRNVMVRDASHIGESSDLNLKAIALRHKTTLTRTLAIALFLLAWECAYRLGAANPLFFSGPSLIIEGLIKGFVSGSIWPHLAASGEVALLGYILSLLIGIPIGLLMGRSTMARDVLEPFIMAFYSAPTAAFLPLLIIWFGIGLGSKVILVVTGGIFVIIINTQAGVANVDRRLIEIARSFMAGELTILRTVVLPSALPFIFAGMRLAIGRVLIMVVVAELFASNAGVGYLIFQAGAMYDTTSIFIGVIILSLTGVAANSALRALERRLMPWAEANSQ
jgi:ABC-type nitrate/sulfonate/bicarbonate transport system permease component